MCKIQREANGFLEDLDLTVQVKILYRDNCQVLYACTCQLMQTNVEQKQKPGLLSPNMGDNDFGINTC